MIWLTWLAYLSTEKTRAILPMARILLRITSLRKLAAAPDRERDNLVRKWVRFVVTDFFWKLREALIQNIFTEFSLVSKLSWMVFILAWKLKKKVHTPKASSVSQNHMLISCQKYTTPALWKSLTLITGKNRVSFMENNQKLEECKYISFWKEQVSTRLNYYLQLSP